MSHVIVAGGYAEARLEHPKFIERVRAVSTDGAGRYSIVDLRPGTYTVTFTLPGFNTVRREGIQLSGSFVATIDVELVVGALQETITVTGEAPVVDVQSTTRQRVLTSDVIDEIPTSRNHYSLTVLVPGVTTSQQDVGGDDRSRNRRGYEQSDARE